MKTLLFTGHDDKYSPLAELTVPRMLLYAQHSGFDFTCYRQPLADIPNGIYWTGVLGALSAFDNGYDRAIYLDADQVVTNIFFRFPDWRSGFHASRDWGEDAKEPWQFSMCGFVAHRDSELFLQSIERVEQHWRSKPFPEQGPAQCIARETPGAVITANRRLFNAVPSEICPGKVPEPWQPMDFCAHLTMLSLQERIKLFYEFKKK